MSKSTGDDLNRNLSGNRPMESVLEAYLSRRSVMRGGLGAAIAMIAGTSLTGCFDSDDDDDDDAPLASRIAAKLALGFESIAGSKTDACVVPAGYSAFVLAPWGTPLTADGNPWKGDGSNTASDQANAMGMHHDGMHYFPIDGSSSDGLLVVNFEYLDRDALHPNGATSSGGKRPAEEVRKEINAHGVGVVRIRKVDGRWQVVDNDPLNRRFTTASAMELAGPLRGTEHVKTKFSPTGTQCRGTNNNCGNGYTPWGTYLTCEENWPNIFVNKSALPEDQARIGISTSRSRYEWETAAGDASEEADEFSRFDVTPGAGQAIDDYRNEASAYGYIVEIDPHDPSTTAVKRTALGRFRHEGCWPGLAVAGKPLVWYSGDDARHEYLYKFVSDAPWDPADATAPDRLATGNKYLDHGKLYVARFDADGSGAWLLLDVETPTRDGATLQARFNDLPGIILNTRGAADAVGATPMDRPEWTAVNPLNGDAYLTLTNNSRRTEANAANPRVPNRHGHIIRWHDSDDHQTFEWDIFVFGAHADGPPDINRSGLTELNQFASPDGMSFDSRGILWIQTDNGEPNVTDYTNDQMLAVIPGDLVDAQGEQIPINAENQAALRRFFVGPNDCEVTGIAFTPDNRTMFVNIQHPGNWPLGDDATRETPLGVTVRPRSATVAIQRDDGGEIGV